MNETTVRLSIYLKVLRKINQEKINAKSIVELAILESERELIIEDIEKLLMEKWGEL